MKQRLNEHIAYLQAEIRKRDEFMETSDFDDDSDISNNSEDEANQTTNQDLLDDNEHDIDDEFIQKFQKHLDRSQSLKSHDTNKAQTPRVKQNDESPSDANVRKIDDQIRQQLQKADQRRQKKKTMQQLLKEQIEDSRSQLKKEIEERMLVERENRQKEESVHKLKEGLGDVMRVIKDIVSVNIECQ